MNDALPLIRWSEGDTGRRRYLVYFYTSGADDKPHLATVRAKDVADALDTALLCEGIPTVDVTGILIAEVP